MRALSLSLVKFTKSHKIGSRLMAYKIYALLAPLEDSLRLYPIGEDNLHLDPLICHIRLEGFQPLPTEYVVNCKDLWKYLETISKT